MFAKHLEQRLKMMACDMLESSLNRTLQSFQNWEKKGSRFGTNVTDYIVPSEMCVMVNVVLETRNQSLKLCTFDGVDVVSFCSYSLSLTLTLTLTQIHLFLLPSDLPVHLFSHSSVFIRRSSNNHQMSIFSSLHVLLLFIFFLSPYSISFR